MLQFTFSHRLSENISYGRLPNISYEEIDGMERCCPSTFHPYFVFPGVAAVIQFTVLSIHRLWRFDDKQWFEMSEINDVMVNLPK